jgi:5-formyltetrahydrofolate cyclo-ligase
LGEFWRGKAHGDRGGSGDFSPVREAPEPGACSALGRSLLLFVAVQKSPIKMKSPLEPELHREVVSRAKKQLRSRMRSLRGAYSKRSLEVRSAAICSRLGRETAGIRSVALFWPMEGQGEVDLRSLDAELRKRGDVRLYYPFMDPTAEGGFTTGFRLSDDVAELRERGRGFCEPPSEAPQARRGDLELVMVPALVADARGHRIGYGAGYYDATLGDVCPPAEAWIVAYQFQLMAELPAEEHDFACDVVATDERLYRMD